MSADTRVVQMANAATKSLDVEQRNLLSVAFKNVVGACRASWRALNAYEASPEIQTDKEMTSMSVLASCCSW